MKKSEPTLKRTITLSIEIFVLLFLMVSGILLGFFPKVAMKVLGFNVYTISYTGSMEPELKYNDLIFVKRYNFNSINEGDIITFEVENKDGEMVYITHKVERKYLASDGTPLAVTKGINIKHADIVPVSEHGIEGTNRFVGKFAFKSRALGNILAFLRSPQGATTLVVNVICIFGIGYILKPKPFNSQILTKHH